MTYLACQQAGPSWVVQVVVLLLVSTECPNPQSLPEAAHEKMMTFPLIIGSAQQRGCRRDLGVRPHAAGRHMKALTSRTPPNAADLAAERSPVRKWRKPPVKAPAEIAFQGSSCYTTPQRVTLTTIRRAKLLPRDLQRKPSRGCRNYTFLLIATREQSKVENRPPQTAKLPPSLGASLRIACRAPQDRQILCAPRTARKHLAPLCRR